MIKIRNLVKEFSGQKVLDGIDMDIEKGRLLPLLDHLEQENQPFCVV